MKEKSIMENFLPIAEAMTEDERLRTAYRLLTSGTFRSWHFAGNGTHVIFEDGNVNVSPKDVKDAEEYADGTDLKTGGTKKDRSFIGGFMIAIMSKMNLRNRIKLVLLSGYGSFPQLSESLSGEFNVHKYEQDEYAKLVETETPKSLIKEAFEELKQMASNDEIDYNPCNFNTNCVYDDIYENDPDITPISRNTHTLNTNMRHIGDLSCMGLVKLEVGVNGISNFGNDIKI